MENEKQNVYISVDGANLSVFPSPDHGEPIGVRDSITGTLELNALGKEFIKKHDGEVMTLPLFK